MIVDDEVLDEERLVRCIGHDLYYSRKHGRVTSTAYLPPPGSNEVSLLRSRYATADQCKQHAKSIRKGNYTYIGLALTAAQDIRSARKHFDTMPVYPDGKAVELLIRASPLDENLNPRTSRPVRSTDRGLPFHADLIYNFIPVVGKTAPNALKKIAKYLAKNPPTVLYVDAEPEVDEWRGDELPE